MSHPPAPRVALLLPVAVFLHQLEEWFGGFVGWVDQTVGLDLGPERFLTVNAVGLVAFTAGILAAVSFPGAAWFAGSLATLMVVNGVAHLVGSLVYGTYSPGVATGLLLFVPLGLVVLRRLARRLPKPVFVAAIIGGVLFHAFATLAALS